MDLLESPPDGLHVVAVHGLVVVLEVNPSTKSSNDLLPLLRVGHDDLPAQCVVRLDTK